jgi:hypothetical protein
MRAPSLSILLTLYLASVSNAATRTWVSVTFSQSPTVAGQPVTMTATVKAIGGGGTPTGTVTFKDTATVLGTAPINGSGQAILGTPGLALGTHPIVAAYGGDATFSASASDATPLAVASRLNCSPSFVTGQTPFPGRAVKPSTVFVADFNQDGKPDVSVIDASNTLVVALGDGAGGFAMAGPGLSLAVLGAPTSYGVPVSADFNLDGKPDLAFGGTRGIFVVLGDGAGGFTLAPGPFQPTPVTQLKAADFDRDGKPDLAASSPGSSSTTGSVILLRGDGTGDFSATTPSASVPGDAPIAVADFDGNGLPDVAAVVPDRAVAVYWGDGAGGLTAGPKSPIPWGQQFVDSMKVTDFNRDGLLDLFFETHSPFARFFPSLFEIDTVLGDGLGQFSAPKPVYDDVNLGLTTAAAVDLNLDGWPDLSGSVPNRLTSWLADTARVFTATDAGPGGRLADNTPVADFNLDGVPDLLLSTFSSLSTLINRCGRVASPQLVVNDVTANSASTTKMFFQVLLTVASSNPASVSYATSDQTAQAGTDYTPVAGTLNFAPGETRKTLEVTIAPQAASGTKTFKLTLAGPTGAALAKDIAVGSIVNPDSGSPILYIDDPILPNGSGVGPAWHGNVTVSGSDKGGSLVGFNVRLSEPSSSSVTVKFRTVDGSAQAGIDYADRLGTLTFEPGRTSRTVLVSVAGNRAPQPNLTFSVALTDAVGAAIGKGQGTATIICDDPVENATRADQFRLYSPVTLEHLFTGDLNEYATLGERGWSQEGKAYTMFKDPGFYAQGQPVPLYRLYHGGIRQHHWTVSSNEAMVLTGVGWEFEGTAGYVMTNPRSGTTPFYRLNLTQPPAHLWTTDVNEKNVLAQRGWVYEGIVGYVIP